MSIWINKNKSQVKLIAEIGCNHMGNKDYALKMIEIASNFCNADIIKFQKRNPKELLTHVEYNSPHPNPSNSFGKNYGKHREFLEFDIQFHKKLKKKCESLGKVYSSSVWDITSAKEIVSLRPVHIKIPSAHNMNFPLLEYLCKFYNKQIHVSLGMTNYKEEFEIIKFFKKRNKLKNLVLYACTSSYPVKSEDISILEVKRLVKDYANKIHSVGFSGHHNGIGIDNIAISLGAKFIERHFTLDRTWKGTDHAASLEPDGLRRLKSVLLETELALSYKKKPILDCELEQRKKLKKIFRV